MEVKEGIKENMAISDMRLGHITVSDLGLGHITVSDMGLGHITENAPKTTAA